MLRKKLTLTLVLDDSVPALYGDREEIIRVLTNLIENAINYTSQGSVSIHTDSQNGQARITITDSGIGISPENRDRIFERFYRTDEARRVEVGGTGLGLAIVKKIVEMHDGTITVQSEHGQGSTFTVRLPYRSPMSI